MANFTDKELESSRLLFNGECCFVRGVKEKSQLQELADLPEIAFVGSSNVGKSSLINTLTFRKKLARTSSSPGATRQVNFFDLRGKLMLVDLPGYGFAKVSKQEKRWWSELIRYYLCARKNLRRVFILIDARRSIKKNDLILMDMLDEFAINYQLVVTKIDKVKKSASKTLADNLLQQTGLRPALHPDIVKTSCKTKEGIDILRCHIASLIENKYVR